MYTVSVSGKMSAVNTRYPNAREALKAYRRLEDEGASPLSVTDNRVHEVIEVSDLKRHAHAEELEAGRP